jgi:hypothetical protein
VGFLPAPIHTGQAPFSAPSVPTRLSFLIFAASTFERRYGSILLSAAHSIRPDV